MSSVDQGVVALGPGDPRLLGSWALAGRLGAGGMGVVYLGRKGDRTAAVKAISPALVDSPGFRERFGREIDICRRVSGAQVAELYDADPEASQPWLAVRYVQGPTLDRCVHAHGPLTGATLEGFALAVAEALRQIHAAGVTHRDLKPSNVILTAETPVLIDFGIAAIADATSLTATGTSMGSAGWMAPEQILGNPTGPATDVFAWGALVAFASTGRPPFGVGRPESLSYRVVHGSPDLDLVPDQYRAIVEGSLSMDPAERPTVRELLDALDGDHAPTEIATAIAATWVGDDATRLSTPVTEPGTAAQPAQRERQWRVPAFIAAVLVLIATAAGALYVDKSNNSEAEGSAAPPSTEVPQVTQTTATTTSGLAPTTTEAPPTSTTEVVAPATTTPVRDRFPMTLEADGRPLDIPLGHARVGDCLEAGPSLPPAVSDYVTRTPCGVAHSLEVASQFPLDFTRSQYPGVDALFGAAEPACYEAFEDYVGAPLGVEFVALTYAVPMEDEWAGGFSEAMCLLVGTEGEPLTGSKQDLRG